MRQHTETSREEPSTDGTRSLQRVYGDPEPERYEDQNQAGDTVDDRAVDPVQPEYQTQAEGQWDADEQAAAAREAVDDERRDPAARQDEQPYDAVADDEPPSSDEPTDFKPGDAPAATVTPIWSDDSARDFRDRWREAQLSFVDDPQKAADDIRTLVDESVEALTVALASQREQLDSWPDNRDTEQYRMVVQRYRTFFERLLAV